MQISHSTQGSHSNEVKQTISTFNLAINNFDILKVLTGKKTRRLGVSRSKKERKVNTHSNISGQKKIKPT